MIKQISILLLITIFAICADTGFTEGGSAVPEQIAKEMDAKINKMTYDDALQSLGQPNTVTQGDNIFIATWRTENLGRKIDPNATLGLTPEQILMLYSIPSSHGEEVQLTFSKSTRLLKVWKYKNW